ncbi:MAG: hypothetical protein KC478_12290, partial [Bacteriovoracaceae bacterium]|nr:hypothetical protein [Bacteriovoracaceae bacterium]
MIKLLVLTLSLVLGTSAVHAQAPKNLDQLLNQVKKQRIDIKKSLSKREQKFVAEKNKQQAALAKAKKELELIQAQTKSLQATFEENEKSLASLEDKLTIAAGNLGEMFGVVKQVAGDFKGQFQNSIISAQIPGRDKLMSALAEKKKLPAIGDLNKLWFEMQREMTESGKVTKFKSQVVTPDGTKAERTILRVGA